MKVALALCGLAIFAQSSGVAAKKDMAVVDEPEIAYSPEEATITAPELQEPEMTWEMLNPPGSSKYSLPMEYWDENIGGLIDPEPVSVQEPSIPMENLRGIPPDWVLQGRSGPFDVMEEPMVIDGPLLTNEPVPKPSFFEPPVGLSGEPPSWVFRDRFTPADDALPWSEAMDLNANGVVTADEYTDYVAMLRGRANWSIDRGGDAKGMALLRNIVDYHYSNLQDCLLRMHETVKLEDLPSVCNVKFRYSVLAGAAPFEWIARALPEIPVDQVVNWYGGYFEKVRADLQSGRVQLDDAAIASLKKYWACIKEHSGPEMVNRSYYYKLVEATQACVTRD